jgi:NTE family protein
MQVQLNFRRAKRPTHLEQAHAIVGAMYSWGKSPDEILDFVGLSFSVEAFHFKKAGLVDSESFRLYFQAIFKTH